MVPAIRSAVLAALAVAALAGCSTHTRLGNSLVAQGVEGMWASQGGVSVSRFSRGAFQTTAGDRQMARGTYQTADDGAVRIDMRLFDGTSRRVICKLVTANQLDCATADSQFTLQRV